MHFIVLAVLALHAAAPIGTQAAAAKIAIAQRAPSAVTLREDTVASAALGREMKYRVLLPRGYEGSLRRYPVLYLLHGLGGNYTDWTTRTNLAEYAAAIPLIIVMPDAENGWYIGKYEDYVTTELQADVVRKYRTINSRYGRAIAGLSMGGYGALKTALKRPAMFVVAGSFSGALSATVPADPVAARLGAEEVERLDTIFGAPDSQVRKDNSVVALASTPRANGPFLYLDCGTSDPWLAGNRLLADALAKNSYNYEFHEVPGGHSWDYWDRRIREFLPWMMKKLANN
jgi:S-formylglutathione hydrolase FrmB